VSTSASPQRSITQRARCSSSAPASPCARPTNGEQPVDAHAFEERVVLGQVPQPRAHLERRAARVEARHLDRARVGREVGREHAQHGRLARAVLAQEADDLAGGDGEAHVVDRDGRAEAARDGGDADHRWRPLQRRARAR
jgi:hypothetical protein